ncbi:GMC oxidoreductase [Motilibacter aurantiacus]|uniref:GMC oxidoreductase n=1 Tax=Motilibacter aurantiacus TaxID=2714955 RepID=UPI001407A8E4|nr:GMC oxidoreductase [Motilibacter aurantiacus]NHC45338.1 GMC family oxidoreductase [Motilibacter aurantiacus]
MGTVDRLSKDSYAALVVGTGFGGAVAAARLAQAGVDLAVVERGRRFGPGDFPRKVTRIDDGWLWPCGHGLYDVRPLNDIMSISAAGYGGGSLVYANVALRPPAEVFDEQWPAGWTRAELDPYYDLASTMLGVGPVQHDPATGELPPKTLLVEEAHQRTGRASTSLRPNLAITFGDPSTPVVNRFGVAQPGCSFCGECDIGCNTGAKNSLDKNYLALAESCGADIGTLTEVVSIEPLRPGFRVVLREHDPDDGDRSTQRTVTAATVVLCAGAVGTTELLLRNRDELRTLPALSTALGHGFSGNGDFLSFGRGTAAAAYPSQGPTITTTALVRAQGEGRDSWFVLQDGGYSRHLAQLVRMLDVAALPAHVAALLRSGARRVVREAADLASTLEQDDDRTLVMLAMGRDRADGRLELTPRGRLRVRWDVARNSALYAAEQAASGELVRALGAEPLVTPTWRLLRQPVTVHNLGGARMSEDPRAGVVDSDGQVHGYPGLYVFDGAALPGATGANPSLTIAAVAERCVERLVRALLGDPAWRAPEHAVAVRPELPEDAAVEVARRAPAQRLAPRRGLRFTERMRGVLFVDGVPRAAEARLHVHAPDLAAVLADPVHALEVSGTVQIAGVTAGPTPVHAGRLHLLAPHPKGRSMSYVLPFLDAQGQERQVHGSKRVWRGTGGPWAAVTRMQAAVGTAGAWGDEDGELRIPALEVARMLTTLRPHGPHPVGTLAAFAWGFARGVAAGLAARA